MTLHLSLSMILKLKEFKDLKIWLRSINPTPSGATRTRKTLERARRGNNNNTLNDQEPTHYYFDLNAIEAPIITITISFHLPVPFYDTREDWGCYLIQGNPEEFGNGKTENNMMIKMQRTNNVETQPALNVQMYYCSKDCQNEDWKDTKRIVKRISKHSIVEKTF